MVISLFLIYGTAQLSVVAWYYGKDLIHTVSTNFQSIRIALDDHNSGVSYLKVDKSTFHSKVKDREILLNGSLYDIIKTKSDNQNIYLTLEKDEIESYLIRQYNELTNWIKKHHPSKRSEDYVLNWMMKLYFSSAYKIVSNNSTIINAPVFVSNNKYLPPAHFEIPAKPPEQRVTQNY